MLSRWDSIDELQLLLFVHTRYEMRTDVIIYPRFSNKGELSETPQKVDIFERASGSIIGKFDFGARFWFKIRENWGEGGRKKMRPYAKGCIRRTPSFQILQF